MATAVAPAAAGSARGPDAPARGRFVTLEGLEGVGKTTNLAAAVEALRARGIEPLVTREPGGTPVGERLRALVLHDGVAMLPRTELLLVAAARLEHVTTVIEPALAAGTWVVSDRYLDSSVAYQGGGRGLGATCVEALHAHLGIDLAPDLTLLLDAPPAAGRARAAGRGAPDRIEAESAAFFERARAAFLVRAAAEPARVAVIDATAPLERVAREVAARIDALVDASGRAGAGASTRAPTPDGRADGGEA